MTTSTVEKTVVIKKDFLHIQWGVRNKLHKRYVVIKKNGEVSIWMSDDLKNPKKNCKHSFFLKGEESVVLKSSKAKMYRFKIMMADFRHNKKKYTFGSESEDIRDEWMYSFAEVLNGLVWYCIMCIYTSIILCAIEV